MDIKEIFAQRLIQLREDNDVTQQTLADDLGITRQSLSLYEKADRTTNIDLLYKIAKYFNVSADYLLGFTKNKTTDTNLKAVCDYIGLSEEAVKTLSDIKKSVEDGVALQPQILKYLSYIISWNIEEFVTDIAFNHAAIQEKKDEKEQLYDTINDFSVTLITSQNPIEDIEDNFTTLEKIRNIDEEIAFIEFKNTRCFHKLLTSFYDLLDDILADES